MDENKRHGNEQRIKKGKVVLHVTSRVRPEGVAGAGRPVCSKMIDCFLYSSNDRKKTVKYRTFLFP